jgi:hypothetical protein
MSTKYLMESVPANVDRRSEMQGDGFRKLYKWLAGADFLIVRADRREPSRS